MQVIRKQLNKKEKELLKLISKNEDNQKIPQTERKIESLKKKLYHKFKKIDTHRDFVVSHEKITKLSSHNLKYQKKLNFKNHLDQTNGPNTWMEFFLKIHAEKHLNKLVRIQPIRSFYESSSHF